MFETGQKRFITTGKCLENGFKVKVHYLGQQWMTWLGGLIQPPPPS